MRYLYPTVATVAALVLISVLVWSVHAQTPAADGGSSEPPTTEIERLQAEIDALRDEIDSATERISKVDDRAHSEMAAIMSFSQWVLALIAFAATLAIAYSGYLTRRWKLEYEKLQQTQADLTSIRESLIGAWSRFDQTYRTLPEEERDVVAGAEDRDNEIDCERAALADYDLLLVVSDRLGITQSEPDELARRFVRLVRFWRSEGEFCRALARADRALELAPRSGLAMTEKAITLSAMVSVSRIRAEEEKLPSSPSPDLRVEWRLQLEKALHLVQQAERSYEGPRPATRQARGFIYDEQGFVLEEPSYFGKAIAEYGQAKKLNDESSEPDRERLGELITYNLACSLTSAGKLEEALDELEKLIDKGPHLEQANVDPQLAPLREGEPGVRLQALLERDRECRNSGT